MDKMKLQSPDLVAANVEKIAELFPNCVTEAKDADGKPKRAINFDMLRQMLSDYVVEGDEAYEFTWVGKRAAIVEANRPIRKTLRPCPEESKDWDTTQNLYIEGDNLEVLKLLQESYLGKVKMIYIDPPYNTGNDFIYRDNFAMRKEEWSEESGEWSEDGERLFRNTDSNGRFHSDWCSMMYSRLLLARNLLADDGVIFISIDDNELNNLLAICNEIFGSSNFESCIAWRRRTNQPNDKSKMIAKVSENIVVFSKCHQILADRKSFNGIPLTDERKSEYKNPDNDPKGPWTTNPWKVASGRGGTTYTITTPSGINYTETWYGTSETFEKLLNENRVYWTDNGNGYPRIKIYLSDVEKEGQAAINFFTCDRFGSNQEGSAELESIFTRKGIFDNPKPTRLLNALIKLASNECNIIMDFFSGTGTTAHAVMQLNAENDDQRQFIMVQLQEPCPEGSEAAKAGYKNICEIGKERIRRAGEKIKSEMSGVKDEGVGQLKLPTANSAPPSTLDVGFRVFKVDDSNMKDVYYSPGDIKQRDLPGQVCNIKEDRTDLDLLFGCLLDWGLPLSLPYSSEKIGPCTVHTYNEGDLIACFDENIPENVIREIARRKPLRAVFRDAGFADSPAKINVFEIFKHSMPESADDIRRRVKVI